jgi:hypothetical protein
MLDQKFQLLELKYGGIHKIICIRSRNSKGEMMILHAPSTLRLGWIAKEINEVFTKW